MVKTEQVTVGGTRHEVNEGILHQISAADLARRIFVIDQLFSDYQVLLLSTSDFEEQYQETLRTATSQVIEDIMSKIVNHYRMIINDKFKPVKQVGLATLVDRILHELSPEVRLDTELFDDEFLHDEDGEDGDIYKIKLRLKKWDQDNPVNTQFSFDFQQ